MWGLINSFRKERLTIHAGASALFLNPPFASHSWALLGHVFNTLLTAFETLSLRVPIIILRAGKTLVPDLAVSKAGFDTALAASNLSCGFPVVLA